MKRLAIILILILPLFVHSQDSLKYDYIIISQAENNIYLTEGPDKHEVISVKGERGKLFMDNSPLLKRVMEYEDEGWDVITYEAVVHPSLGIVGQFVLRRKRK
jgi:hypothetical protein